MMLKIEIDLDNAAMLNTDEHGLPIDGDVSTAAVAETLWRVSEEIAQAATGGTLMDLNGNTVGRWEIED